MCYSAMVEQNAKKLGLRFKARIQTDMYDELFSRRLAGEKISINKAMEETFLLDPKGAQEGEIAEKIKKWHAAQIKKIEAAIFTQKKRLSDAVRALESEPTKKAQNDRRIATDKIAKFLRDLEKHRSLNVLAESDQRIFPQHYVSMLATDERGEPMIMPVRYLMRPSDKDESFDAEFNGCYNARFDSIDRVPWWKNALGKRHGLMLVRKFYENVPCERYALNFSVDEALKTKKSVVLCFEPEKTEFMYIPMLWDVWKKAGCPTLYSGALITDEPAPEIALAGHDRTPIFLKSTAIEGWLNAKGTAAEIKPALCDRERPKYIHKIFSAA